MALEHVRIELEQRRLLLASLRNSPPVSGFLAAGATLRVERFAKELQIRNAGNFDRVLEAEEKPCSGALVRLQIEQIHAVELDRSLRHLVTGTTANST